MKNIHLRLLQHADAAPLLQFEQENRTWFERHIRARPEDFYSTQGVVAHIHELLKLNTNAGTYPGVLVDPSGAIIGRANLKGISQENAMAEVGYRIGAHYVNQGMATLALAHLIEVARSHYAIKSLIAFVTQENIASARVLEKRGFVQGEHIQNLTEVRGKVVAGFQYVLALQGEVNPCS